MIGDLKRKLSNALSTIQVLIETPGAFNARRAGCYLNLYKIVYHLRAIGLRPEVIIDVGANRGMFSRCAHYVFPHAGIYAFEPLKHCYGELCKLKNTIKNLYCYNVALGAEEGESIIHRSNYDYSSSLLEMGDVHKEAFPYTSGEQLEVVQVRTLDRILNDKPLQEPILMKIDVQGYEKYVLEGARKTLRQTDYVICEMSTRPLYKRQPLFDEVYRHLVDAGFRFSGQVGELTHPQTSEVLQIDGLFVREKQ